MGQTHTPTTSYAYNASGQISTITNDNGDVFTCVYGENGRVVGEIDFDGTVTQIESVLGTAIKGDEYSGELSYPVTATDQRGFVTTA